MSIGYTHTVHGKSEIAKSVQQYEYRIYYSNMQPHNLSGWHRPVENGFPTFQPVSCY